MYVCTYLYVCLCAYMLVCECMCSHMLNTPLLQKYVTQMTSSQISNSSRLLKTSRVCSMKIVLDKTSKTIIDLINMSFLIWINLSRHIHPKAKKTTNLRVSGIKPLYTPTSI